MLRSPHSRWLIGALLTLASGCTTLKPISPATALSHRALEVHFATPIWLVARRHTGEEVVRRNVTSVTGRPLEVRNDTLVLEITRWRGLELWHSESPALVAAVPAADACTNVGTRQFSAWRSASLLLGPPVLAWVLLFIGCSLNPCFT